MQKHKVEFNALCVLSQANVEKPKEIYQFFRGLGIDYIQYIPLSEFDDDGKPLPVHHHARTVRPLHVRDLRPVVAGAAQGADPLLR